MSDRIQLKSLSICAGNRVLVEDIRLELKPGRLVALVGSSGSGKTLTCRALLGMVDADPGVVDADLLVEIDGQITCPYANLGRRHDRRRIENTFRKLRGEVLGWLPQNSRGSLDPLWKIGRQVTECLALAEKERDPTPYLARAGFSDPVAT